MILADSAFVFPEGDVQRPMQAVFGAPKFAYRLAELFGIAFQAGDEVASLGGDLASDLAPRLHHADAFESGPLRSMRQPVDIGYRPVAASFDAPMIGVEDFMGVDGVVAKASPHICFEKSRTSS